MAGMGFEQLQSSERTERTPGPSERLTFFTFLYLVADIYISEINLHDPTVPTVLEINLNKRNYTKLVLLPR